RGRPWHAIAVLPFSHALAGSSRRRTSRPRKAVRDAVRLLPDRLRVGGDQPAPPPRPERPGPALRPLQREGLPVPRREPAALSPDGGALRHRDQGAGDRGTRLAGAPQAAMPRQGAFFLEHIPHGAVSTCMLAPGAT